MARLKEVVPISEVKLGWWTSPTARTRVGHSCPKDLQGLAGSREKLSWVPEQGVAEVAVNLQGGSQPSLGCGSRGGLGVGELRD